MAESGESERSLADSDDADGKLTHRKETSREATDCNYADCPVADGYEASGDSVGACLRGDSRRVVEEWKPEDGRV
ncbi:MAG: hypothetical protein WAM82_09870 [Thermoanaerobaculia bacterium]